MQALRKLIHQRLSGQAEKELICRNQLLSSYLFFPCGLALLLMGSAPLGVMFTTEAIGQWLMARDNLESLKKGDPLYRYLSARPLGRLACAVFGITAFSRYWLATAFMPHAEGLLLLVGSLSFGLMLMGAFWRRPEEPGGLIIWGSALVIRVIACRAGGGFALSLSVFHFLYAGLLVIGVLLLKASRAEAINIGLWLALFVAFLASPHT